SDVRDRDGVAAPRTLYFYGGRRACRRKLFEGGDGLEGAKKHGHRSWRARHTGLTFSSRFSRTKRLHHEPDEHRSAQDGFVREVRLATRVVSVHRFFVAC